MPQLNIFQLGLSDSEVADEVNALSTKIAVQSEEDLREKKEELLRDYEKRRSTAVTEMSAVSYLGDSVTMVTL